MFEFGPNGVALEYVAMAIGNRSQGARTYLEKHIDDFAQCQTDALIVHAMGAIRDTMPIETQATFKASSVIIGVLEKGQKFRIVEGEEALGPYLARLAPPPIITSSATGPQAPSTATESSPAAGTMEVEEVPEQEQN